MYLRKYKFSKAAFLESTSQMPSLYIIWFRISPRRKYYFMSETYLKLSQTSKMKLLAKVINASRDVFRTVFSIQNIFRTSRIALFTKIMNEWKPLTFSAKSSILISCWVLNQNFANFTGKHLCWSLFLIKFHAFRSATILIETPTYLFSCEICETFTNNYFEKHLRTTALHFLWLA